jgi:hypothetical protein
VKRQAKVTARLHTYRPGQFVGKGFGIIEKAVYPVRFPGKGKQPSDRNQIVADDAFNEMLRAGLLNALRHKSTRKVFVDCNINVFIPQKITRRILHSLVVNGKYVASQKRAHLAL